jgi:F-type H+-transporting ATPase subunit b
MESLITTFHIDWKIIVAQAINFGIVFLVLYFFALKPLGKMMRERTDTITGGLNDAQTNKELLLKTKKEYDTIVANARTEANVIFQDGKKEAEIKKAEMLENAKKEVANMILSGKKVLESEKAKIVEEAKQEIVSLVVKATEKLLESESTEKFDENAINKIKKM